MKFNHELFWFAFFLEQVLGCNSQLSKSLLQHPNKSNNLSKESIKIMEKIKYSLIFSIYAFFKREFGKLKNF